MVYLVENCKVTKTDTKNIATDARRYWAVFSFEEAEEASCIFGLGEGFLSRHLQNRATRYESHDGFDVIHYNPLQYGEDAIPVKQACMYAAKNVFILLADNKEAVCSIVDEISAEVEKALPFDRLFYTFLERTTQDDASYLEEIEQDISLLEDQLITTNRKNCVVEIISLRKKLMLFKRHYEQTLEVLDDVQENENELIDQKSMRYFKIYANRVDRLYHIVLNLRDYVTQVREAYQAEVDISLNSIMKLFTVMTAIFLPLTLIVGWYGMNLKLPEFDWPYGYPMVIALSAAVVVFCLVYFRKHHWFK
ncbi:MAG: CorA family divalent cation transporter [Eubacteriales bacterium]